MKALRPACMAVLSCLVALATTSCSRNSASARPGVLAEVGDTPIDQDAFLRWWSKAPPRTDTPEARDAVLKRVIRHTQAVRRARELGLDKDPEVIEAFESILLARLEEVRLKPALAAARVSESEARACYDAARDTEFRVGPRARVAVIWLDARKSPPLAARHRARLEDARSKLIEEGLRELSPEQGFGEWSIRHSEHRATRFRGGDLGWVEIGKASMDPWRNAVAEIAATLGSPGEVSPVVVRDEGVFLVRLMALSPGRVRPFEEAKAEIENLLLGRRQAAAREEFEQWIAREGPLRLHPEALAALAIPDLPDEGRARPAAEVNLTHSSLR
jgi:hypothetical protein